MELDTLTYIDFLGAPSLRYGERSLTLEDVRSRRFWMPLAYLLCFREREVAQAELIDLIYPNGEVTGPGNALKTLIHRIRNTLATLGHPCGRSMIRNARGTYAWNPLVDIRLDVDVFAANCARGEDEDLPEEERLAYLLEALALYKGDFLQPFENETWVTAKAAYYRNLFSRALQTAINLLEQRGDFTSIVRLCEQAGGIDPYDEGIHKRSILAKVQLGETQAALREYNMMSSLLYNELGVSPSDELRALYRDIIRTVRNAEADIGFIKEDLQEGERNPGAYLCEYEVFKDIYRLEVRAASRSGEPMFLCLLTLEPKQGEGPSVKSLNRNMAKLETCIRLSLRQGDVFSKYSVSQFILMLATSYENSVMVMDRIAKRFRRENPRSPYNAVYSVRAADLQL